MKYFRWKVKHDRIDKNALHFYTHSMLVCGHFFHTVVYMNKPVNEQLGQKGT